MSVKGTYEIYTDCQWYDGLTKNEQIVGKKPTLTVNKRSSQYSVALKRLNAIVFYWYLCKQPRIDMIYHKRMHVKQNNTIDSFLLAMRPVLRLPELHVQMAHGTCVTIRCSTHIIPIICYCDIRYMEWWCHASSAIDESGDVMEDNTMIALLNAAFWLLSSLLFRIILSQICHDIQYWPKAE